MRFVEILTGNWKNSMCNSPLPSTANQPCAQVASASRGPRVMTRDRAPDWEHQRRPEQRREDQKRARSHDSEPERDSYQHQRRTNHVNPGGCRYSDYQPSRQEMLPFRQSDGTVAGFSRAQYQGRSVCPRHIITTPPTILRTREPLRVQYTDALRRYVPANKYAYRYLDTMEYVLASLDPQQVCQYGGYRYSAANSRLFGR
ncbi:hypothetical protein U1Q18_049021 [Sarracenia purpurea var. burkii]